MNARTRRLLPLLALSAALLASSCRSTYRRYDFRPRPLALDVPSAEAGDPLARAVVSVIGLRRADKSAGRPEEVHLRISIESFSAEPLSFDPEGWRLLAGDLRELGPPRVEPDAALALSPGGVATLELYFPPAAGMSLGSYDLSGLGLRFAVRSASATVVVNASFERWYGGHYDPYGYWGPPSYWHGYHHPYWRPRYGPTVGATIHVVR